MSENTNEQGSILGWYRGLSISENTIPSIIFRRMNADLRIELYIHSDGILHFLVQTDNGHIYGIRLHEVFNFDPKRPYMISLEWSNSGQLQHILFNGIAQPINKLINPQFLKLPEPISTFNRNKLFLSTLKDLKHKLASSNEYDILKATELIRQLIFDAFGPLVDRVVSDSLFHKNIKYTHGLISENNKSTYLNPDVMFLGSAINPDKIFTNGIMIQTSNCDGFLNSPIIQVNGETVSVLNVLQFVLYKLGGTHQTDITNSTRDKKQKAELLEKFQRDTLYGISSIIGLIVPIGTVVLKGLEELEQHIMDIHK